MGARAVVGRELGGHCNDPNRDDGSLDYGVGDGLDEHIS